MSISIPAIVDTQLAALKATLNPAYHSDTTTYTSSKAPFVLGNRAADLLRQLTKLVDVASLAVQGIHGATDAADAVATADATDPTSGQALANALKAAYNLHIAKTAGNVHWGADGTNNVSTADATDEGTTVALANAIKLKFNLHIVKLTSNTHRFSDAKETITTADSTAYASAYTLLNVIKTKYNLHVVDIGCSVNEVSRTSSFSSAHSLAGSKITFGAATTTVALRGQSVVISDNTVTKLTLVTALPTAPVTGDVFAVEFSSVDDELAIIEGGKSTGDSQSNPYGYGPTLISAMVKLIQLLGGSVPSWLLATPFTIGSPHAGGSAGGHGGAQMLAYAFQLVRDTVAAYTVPA
jgi:hypothetical protein